MKLKISAMVFALSLVGCSTGSRHYVTTCYDKEQQQVSCSSSDAYSTQTHRAAHQAGNAAAQAGNAASVHTMHHTPPPSPPPSF